MNTITTEHLDIICKLTIELTKLRMTEVPHLCIENFAPDVFAKLIASLSAEITDIKKPRLEAAIAMKEVAAKLHRGAERALTSQ